MARCWLNPDAKGCKTCKHFSIDSDGYDECAVDVDLTGRPACTTCNGSGGVFAMPSLGYSECPTCGGDGAEIKSGPVVGCLHWQAR